MDADGRPAATLAELPPGAAGHFRLHLFAVVARLLANLGLGGGAGTEARLLHGLGRLLDRLEGEESDSVSARFPFLDGYRATLVRLQGGEPPPVLQLAWWEEQIDRWQAQAGGHLPLSAVEDDLELERAQVRLLLAAGLVEEDIRFGALFAALQEPLAARRPCLGLLGWLLAEPGEPPGDLWPLCQPLLDQGLLLAENREGPRGEWLLRPPAALWDALRGHPAPSPAPGLMRQAASGFPDLADLILPPALRERAAQLPWLLESGQVRTIVLRGMAGSGRRTLLGSIARVLGRDVLLAEGVSSTDPSWRLLGPLATVLGAMPVLRGDPGPGETLELPALPGYAGPVGITLGQSGGLRGPLLERALSLSLPPPDRPARRQFWEASGAPIAPGELDEIARRFLLTGGHISRAAAIAAAIAALDGRPALIVADVHQATRALNRQALETLATPLEPARGWSDLVVGSATAHELEALEARVRERETLRDRAGPAFERQLNRGVRALFSGPSGTGKTLAARALAAELEMDIYRVDLAAVVNKYIGETERNLNQVLSRAEELDVVLLLDEGDALMASRTEVRTANDRYANLETNYLLQRLESYEGIVIVTTNAGQRIDPAFLRRLDTIVEFIPPGPLERWQIWHSHLPSPNAISFAFLEEVAGRCALNGGQIRNAALQATLLALQDAVPVGNVHLDAAVRREYRRAGAACPLRAEAPGSGHLGRLRQLVVALS